MTFWHWYLVVGLVLFLGLNLVAYLAHKSQIKAVKKLKNLRRLK